MVHAAMGFPELLPGEAGPRRDRPRGRLPPGGQDAARSGSRVFLDHRETLALSIEPLDRADPSADVQPVADGPVGPLDPNPALTIHVRLSAHREPAVTVLEEPWRALVGAIEKPRVHELPEAGRIQVDDGLPAAGNDHGALDRLHRSWRTAAGPGSPGIPPATSGRIPERAGGAPRPSARPGPEQDAGSR